jgi:hypothetical protein
MALWGRTIQGGASSTADLFAVRAMGGTSPNTDGMVLQSVTLYIAGDAGDGPRVAVYQGGSLDNPVGATLVEDLGILTRSGSAGFQTISSATNPSLTKNVPTWIFAKDNNTPPNTTIYFSSSSADAGDFQTARGRADLSGMTGGNSSANAYPSTLDGTSSFSSAWYPWYLDYSIAPPPASGHIRLLFRAP